MYTLSVFSVHIQCCVYTFSELCKHTSGVHNTVLSVHIISVQCTHSVLCVRIISVVGELIKMDIFTFFVL